MTGRFFFGWWQVAVAMIIQGVSAATVFTAYSIVAVPLQEAFDTSRMAVMLGMTAAVLAAGILNPVLGAAMDRYSLRSLMLAGAGAISAGFLALSFTTSIAQSIAVYAILMSVASILLGPMAASALLARWFTRRRGMAMGIAAIGTSIGGLLFPPLIQGLIDAFEWRDALRILSLILLVLTVPVIGLLAVDRPADKNLFPDGETAAVVATVDSGHAKFGSTGGILRDVNFWLIAAAIGFIFAGATGFISNLLPLAIGKGISPDRGALLISILSVGSFTGKVLFASGADRVDLRLALAAACLVLSLSMFSFLQADGYALLAAGSILLGLAAGSVLPLWGFLLARAFGPDNIGRVMGIMGLVIMPLNLFAPPLFGWIYDETGSYNLGFMLCIGLLAAVMILLPKIRTHPPAPVASPAAS